ncbi:Histamine H2 receptor [Trichoplax sp. H2]|uniref:G-protein coupled receptors family 1 profile domain-containing protein n=1 Tax=Trichoplax adhaerens TaxID=10228 RepID=B3RQU6_TRIAD|nr:hypothetical protein TRIADDRAFT_54003 [Trichoplax adhaerens]EDV26767.1 hypothetical protein TRIADDRAFT_54003 [Trichoplax adhaerens]RDD40441.1 Histamine H2 receptor [Trichoplax sp. H2]|eukprot:XP_002110763.1 hypothetical protein TRIADDRAFT_54003 [Trichoplax adhaerens]
MNSNSSTFTVNEIIWLLNGTLTIIVNAILLGIICFNRKLWNFSNTVVISMCATGILWSLLYILPRWAFVNYTSQNWLFCSILPQIGIFFITILNLHLVLISLDKLFAILYPFKYIKFATINASLVGIILIWLIPAFVAVLPFITFRQLSPPDCKRSVSNSTTEIDYLIAVFSLLFFVPLACMLLCYTYVFHIANQQLNKLHMEAKISHSCRIKVRNVKAARRLSIIVAVFTVMWLPYVITFFVYSVAGDKTAISQNTIPVFRYFAFFYPIFNPILYGFFNNNIRTAFVTSRIIALCRRIGRKSNTYTQHESSFLQAVGKMIYTNAKR